MRRLINRLLAILSMSHNAYFTTYIYQTQADHSYISGIAKKSSSNFVIISISTYTTYCFSDVSFYAKPPIKPALLKNSSWEAQIFTPNLTLYQPTKTILICKSTYYNIICRISAKFCAREMPFI